MIFLIGPSGSGKTTLEHNLWSFGYDRVISYTSRPPRDRELPGVAYHFISREEFKARLAQNFFAEHVEYDGDYRGVARADCQSDNAVAVVEANGFRQLRALPGINAISFFLRCSEETRMRRMLARDDMSVDKAYQRLAGDRTAFAGIDGEVDYVIDCDWSSEVEVTELVRAILVQHGFDPQRAARQRYLDTFKS